MLVSRTETEKKIFDDRTIYFHLTDKGGAFSKKHPPTGWHGHLIPDEQKHSEWIECTFHFGLEPEYRVTYDRQLLLETHSATDYIFMEGPRRRRVFWNTVFDDLVHFLVEPYLPQFSLIPNHE